MDEKKLAAATAAVFAHIKTGEEAYAAQLAAEAQAGQSAGRTAGQPVAMANAWGLSGRQAIMQANTMMQLRMFK